MRIVHQGFYFQQPMILQMTPEEHAEQIENNQDFREIIKQLCHEDAGDFLRYYYLFDQKIAVVVEVREARKK